jgi:pimeloyl-ACP methyl ester carboxylesterase
MRFVPHAIGLLFILAASVARSQDAAKTPDSTSKINLVTATLGGKQFWADELVFWDWRIQRNSLTDHCRLLYEHDERRVWGSFDECKSALDAIKKRDHLPPMPAKVVILLHGLGRTRDSMNGMAKFLKENSDFTAITVGYPSTMAEVEQHAKSLSKVIENLDGAQEIDFVAHSLGNLVIRKLAFDQTETNGAIDPRIKRIVMLGPPNNGAQLAATVRKTKFVGDVIGAPVREMADGWNELSKRLATPTCEFGVIAGGKADGHGYNPLLDGDNDMVVTVAETRLKGARDFALFPVLHTFMMDDPRVQKATMSFLSHGYFLAEAKRQPID